MGIKEKVQAILAELPPGVELVAAAKSRTPQEILEAVEAGVKIVGENYLQEAESAFNNIGPKVSWHFIGHLQKNKVKKAVSFFDMIETVDSLEIAIEIDKRAGAAGKIMPVLIEVNSGRELQKFGVVPEEVAKVVTEISFLPNVKVTGLMTMGPVRNNPEDLRTYFQETKRLFDRIKTIGLSTVDMKYLSMGMSDSYLMAIEEGANLIRLGTRIFGPLSSQD
ncbi:MAG: YggS family pyridoxal phosphate-dependent enzyme [Candidatus Omnitrophota bacterium]